MTETIRDWNPNEGDLFQGDVMLFRLPEGACAGQDRYDSAARWQADPRRWRGHRASSRHLYEPADVPR